MEPIKHFYYSGDLAGFAKCGDSVAEGRVQNSLLDYANSKNASGAW
jgi:hypothetical protein